ncbi:MAG: hypothetical protein GY906_21470 [bacterium]|nr:hypothetical protein [bacterium]
MITATRRRTQGLLSTTEDSALGLSSSELGAEVSVLVHPRASHRLDREWQRRRLGATPSLMMAPAAGK